MGCANTEAFEAMTVAGDNGGRSRAFTNGTASVSGRSGGHNLPVWVAPGAAWLS